MPSGPAQAAYWHDFVIARCDFPNPARLAEQFGGAKFPGFCDRGCNSFYVEVRAETPPLARKPKGGRVVFSADFTMGGSGQPEIMLSVDSAGNLDRVEVMCNANRCPISDAVLADSEPFHISASKNLIV